MRTLYFLCASLSAASPLHAAEPLRLASDAWCPFVCASGEHVAGGYLVELTSRALATQGVRVAPLLMPLNRALQETLRGRIDGVYAPAVDARLRLSVPLAYSRACFYTLHDSHWRYSGLASLDGQQLGIIAEYGYDDGPMDDYIARHRGQPAVLQPAYGQAAGSSNLRMLLHGRLPVVLEHEAVMARLADKEQALARLRRAGCLERSLPLTVGFAADHPQAAAWQAALASGLRELQASGALPALRRRYQLPEQ